VRKREGEKGREEERKQEPSFSFSTTMLTHALVFHIYSFHFHPFIGNDLPIWGLGVGGGEREGGGREIYGGREREGESGIGGRERGRECHRWERERERKGVNKREREVERERERERESRESEGKI
jgi:hypothetical protein